jgi:hypothetical protein
VERRPRPLSMPNVASPIPFDMYGKINKVGKTKSSVNHICMRNKNTNP